MFHRRAVLALPFLVSGVLVIATSCADNAAPAAISAPSTGGAGPVSSSSITQVNRCPTICEVAIACAESGPIGCDQTCETMLATQCAPALQALEACFAANANDLLACHKTPACKDEAAAYVACAGQIDMNDGAIEAVSSGSGLGGFGGAGGSCGGPSCSFFSTGHECSCTRSCKATDVDFDCSTIPGGLYCQCTSQGTGSPTAGCMNKNDQCASFDDNCCEK